MNNKEEIRELPWYIGDPEPTPQITEKIVTRFPSYALNRPEISSYYATFYKCRDIVKDYFTERVKQAKSSKMQQIAEEAWKLVSQFVGLFEMGENQDLSRWNVLNDKWNTVIQKFKIYISSGEQQEQPVETGRNTTPAKLRRIWICLKRIPRWICGLVVAVFVAVIAAIVVDIFAEFGWLDRIKAFIYNILQLE